MLRPITVPSIGLTTSAKAAAVLRDEEVQRWVKSGAISFSKGFISYPVDFAIGAHFIMSLLGAAGYGQHARARAELIAVSAVVKQIWSTKDDYVQAFAVLYNKFVEGQDSLCDGVNQVLEAMKSDEAKFRYFNRGMRFGGRTTGSVVTKFVVTGGPYGAPVRANLGASIAISVSMFAVAALGSIIRFLHKHKTSPNQVEFLSAIVLGKIDKMDDGTASPVTRGQLSELIKEIRACRDLPRTGKVAMETGTALRQTYHAIEELRCMR